MINNIGIFALNTFIACEAFTLKHIEQIIMAALKEKPAMRHFRHFRH